MDTETEDLTYVVADGVAVLTLNRPAAGNAVSAPMMQALAALLPALAVDDTVGAVVLTGAGSAFCAGGDLTVMREGRSIFDYAGPLPTDRIRAQQQNQRSIVSTLWRMAKPTIAVLPGPAAGAGLSLALACDLRFAAPNATLTTGFIRVGLSGDYGASWLLTHLLGSARARELCLLSERIDAAEAERIGLLTKVIERDQLWEISMTHARRLAQLSSRAVGALKENLNAATTDELEVAMDREVEHYVALRATEEHRAAVLRFFERSERR